MTNHKLTDKGEKISTLKIKQKGEINPFRKNFSYCNTSDLIFYIGGIDEDGQFLKSIQ